VQIVIRAREGKAQFDIMYTFSEQWAIGKFETTRVFELFAVVDFSQDRVVFGYTSLHLLLHLFLLDIQARIDIDVVGGFRDNTMRDQGGHVWPSSVWRVLFGFCFHRLVPVYGPVEESRLDGESLVRYLGGSVDSPLGIRPTKAK
jgi:hypothetical protein